jgi:hypothetical protein
MKQGEGVANVLKVSGFHHPKFDILEKKVAFLFGWFLFCFVLFCFFETSSPNVAQAGLKQSSYFCFLSAKIKDMHHHT